MSDRLKSLTDARATAWASMTELRTTIGTGSATAEQRAEWDRIEADIVAIGADMEAEARMVKMAGILAEPVTTRVAAEIVEPLKADGMDEARYAAAFGRYIRFGMGDKLSVEDRQMLTARYESRAQSEGTNSAGGYLVPQGYWVKITETMKAFGGLLAEANVIKTASGQALPWPSNNDTGNLGALLSENTQVSEVDLTIGQTGTLQAWTYTSNLVLVSLQLLQDSAFDLDSWLPGKLGTRLGRAVAADLVGGSGSSKPTGLNLAPTAGVTAATGGTVTVTYANLVDLEHSVDAAYRQIGNCKFLMNDLTLGAIRKIVDSNGRPLWLPGFGSFDQKNPESVLGYPVVIDNAMPVMAANAKSILFGDYHAGYVVRQVLDPTIMQLRERYADYLQVGYFGFQRIDGRPDDAAAVRSFVNSAT